MNRKQKIIISVTGIFIVLLILVGLTYAYFLTQITGNTNPKSISVTTANLIVRYEDGDNIILDSDTKLKPSSTAIGTKTFEVVNEGDKADYVVIVDNISIKDATTGVETTFNTNDFVYTLECTSSDGNDCEDVTEQTTLPLKNKSILIGNNIEAGVTHEYTLTLWYLETNVNQSNDMNKSLSVRLNIEDIARINPYSENTSSLAYNIINNTVLEKNGTELLSIADTPVAEDISHKNNLSIAHDDYGISYYYRGNVQDNYLNFADMCWRIVRIEGDGSIKLILEDKNTTCDSDTYTGNWSIGTGNYGYTEYPIGTLVSSTDKTSNTGAKYLPDYLHGTTMKDESMATAFKTFQSTFTDSELEDMKGGDWCFIDKAYSDSESTTTLLNDIQKVDFVIDAIKFYYDGYVRLYGSENKNPSLRCNGVKMSTFEDNATNPTPMFVGAITVDEVMYAGGKVYLANPNYYLINDEFKKGVDGVIGAKNFWTLSLAKFYNSFTNSFRVDYDGYVYDYVLYSKYAIRPSILLKSNVEIDSGGLGTKDKPYVIK